MFAEIDIPATAKLFIKQYGNWAPIAAAQESDACLEKCDYVGLKVWRKVLAEMENIIQNGGGPGVRLRDGADD